MNGKSIGDGAFSLSVYPASQPVSLALTRNGSIEKLMSAGVTIRTAFCGPCFGAGDTPGNNALCIRHATRNFPNREGSKPASGQIASVALMDARSIAATAINGGLLTPATEVDCPSASAEYVFDGRVYENRVYQGFGNARREEALQFGPNIADWPKMQPLAGEPAADAGIGDPRPGDDDGRADPVGRDLILSLRPAETGGVHPVAEGPRLCGPGQGL